MRNGQDTPTISWRGKTIYRVASKQFVSHIDNQLQQSTPLEGLRFLQPNTTDAHWKDWRLWPHGRLCIDMGSDQLTGSGALERHFKLNLSTLPDFDHGAQRSTLEILKATQLHEFWLLMNVSWNLMDGPDQNAYRLHQIKESNADIIARTGPRHNIMFQELVPRIGKELKDAGIELPNETDSDLEIWQYWVKMQGSRAKLERTSQNRFQALLDRAGKALNGTWSIDYFERVHLGLEMNFLGKKAFASRMTMAKASSASSREESAAGAREPTRIAQIEDKTLRGVCENAVGISVAMLADYTHKRVVECVYHALAYIRDRRSDMSRRCKSAEECIAFLTEMSTTGVASHMEQALDPLCNASILDHMGFTLLPSDADRNSVLCEDEDCSGLVFKLVVSGVKARYIRLFDLKLMPKAMVGCLGSAADAKNILKQLQTDHTIFLEVGEADRMKRLNTIYKRHLFHLTPCKQYITACQEVGFGPDLHPDLRQTIEKNNTGACSTNLIEEMVGTVKNFKEVKASSKFRSPQVSFGRLIASKVVEKRSRFDAVDEVQGRLRDKIRRFGLVR